jgi:hypothetical protein
MQQWGPVFTSRYGRSVWSISGMIIGKENIKFPGEICQSFHQKSHIDYPGMKLRLLHEETSN